MKIWEAELIIIDTDFGLGKQFETRFYFEENENQQWKLSSNKNSYYYTDGWIRNDIPVNMKFEHTLTGLKVTQGFTEDKTEEEQKKIKQDMIDYMRECLIKEKNKIIKSYDKKIESLK